MTPQMLAKAHRRASTDPRVRVTDGYGVKIGTGGQVGYHW